MTNPVFKHIQPSPGGREKLPSLLQFSRLTRRTRISRPCSADKFWALDYHLQYAGQFSLDGRHWHRREAYTAHLYAPGKAYGERCLVSDLPFAETYFVFKAEDRGELSKLVSRGDGFARFLDPSGLLLAMLGNLLEPRKENGNSLWRAQGSLLMILDCMLSARCLEGSDHLVVPNDATASPSLAARVDSILREHCHTRIRLDEVARKAGVSRSTLSHQYRQETGKTPVTRSLELRLETARSMILKGERLKIVAANTGFCDEYHLSRVFKARFGKSPRNYLADITSL